MKSSKILKDALASLSNTQQKLYVLLTNKKTQREDVIDFLKHYDIDHETAVSSFLINDLLDRFRLQESDHPSIPRIRGLADFFRFQNATAVMRLAADTPVPDADLVLKLRYPDTIRPFAAFHNFLDPNGFRYLVGKSYAGRMTEQTEVKELQKKTYRIPKEAFLPDILFLSLYRSVRYNGNKENTLCYLYDVYRYCPDKKPSFYLRFSIRKSELRHKLGRIKRWLLRSKN